MKKVASVDDPAFILLAVQEGRHMTDDHCNIRVGIVIKTDVRPDQLAFGVFTDREAELPAFSKTGVHDQEFSSGNLKFFVELRIGKIFQNVVTDRKITVQKLIDRYQTAVPVDPV